MERDTDQVSQREETGEVKRRGTVTTSLAYFKSTPTRIVC